MGESLGRATADGTRPAAAGIRHVIITADDLGFRKYWDARTFEAARVGIISAVSVVAGGPTWSQVAPRLSSLSVDVGVHLNLLECGPLASRDEVRSLVTTTGRFQENVRAFVRRWLARRIRAADVAVEWAAQIEAVRSTGTTVTHLNSHYHLHMLPDLYRVVLELASRFHVPFVRRTCEPYLGLAPPGSRWRQFAKTALLRGVGPLAPKNPPGIRTVRSLGIGFRGMDGVAAYSARPERLPRSPVELICHPGQGESRAFDNLAEVVARSSLRLSMFGSLGTPS